MKYFSRGGGYYVSLECSFWWENQYSSAYRSLPSSLCSLTSDARNWFAKERSRSSKVKKSLTSLRTPFTSQMEPLLKQTSSSWPLVIKIWERLLKEFLEKKLLWEPMKSGAWTNKESWRLSGDLLDIQAWVSCRCEFESNLSRLVKSDASVINLCLSSHSFPHSFSTTEAIWPSPDSIPKESHSKSLLVSVDWSDFPMIAVVFRFVWLPIPCFSAFHNSAFFLLSILLSLI